MLYIENALFLSILNGNVSFITTTNQDMYLNLCIGLTLLLVDHIFL